MHTSHESYYRSFWNFNHTLCITYKQQCIRARLPGSSPNAQIFPFTLVAKSSGRGKVATSLRDGLSMKDHH